MSRVYVATAMANVAAARVAMAELRAAGHEITWDWTTQEFVSASKGTPEWTAEYESFGEHDYRGVAAADFLLLLSHPDGRDSRAEMGIALGMGKPVYVVGAEQTPSVFFGRCRKFASVAAVIAFITPHPASNYPTEWARWVPRAYDPDHPRPRPACTCGEPERHCVCR